MGVHITAAYNVNTAMWKKVIKLSVHVLIAATCSLVNYCNIAALCMGCHFSIVLCLHFHSRPDT